MHFLFYETISTLYVGRYHQFAITNNNKVYAWGNNDSGELGIGTNKQYNIPICATALLSVQIQKISCGLKHTCALSLYGEIYTWGSNQYGQLGTKDRKDRYEPCKLKNGREYYIDIGCGNEFTIILNQEYIFYGSGRNDKVFFWLL